MQGIGGKRVLGMRVNGFVGLWLEAFVLSWRDGRVNGGFRLGILYFSRFVKGFVDAFRLSDFAGRQITQGPIDGVSVARRSFSTFLMLSRWCGIVRRCNGFLVSPVPKANHLSSRQTTRCIRFVDLMKDCKLSLLEVLCKHSAENSS